MVEENRPISSLISQGWEVAAYSASVGDAGVLEHCFLVKRQGRSKIVMVRKKVMGSGVHHEELEV